MSDNNIMGLTFKLESTKNKKGEAVKGVSEADFSMQAKSIFSNTNLNISSVFEDLDTDGDKVLSDKELKELTSYLDEIETDEEDAEEDNVTTEIRNILNGVGDLPKKLNRVKELNLKAEDIKELSVSETQDLLNLIAGAYANEPDKMTNDSLYSAIEKNVPSNVFEDAITSQNSGYWLKKYGTKLMAKSFNSKNGHKIDIDDTAAHTANKTNVQKNNSLEESTVGQKQDEPYNFMFSKEDDLKTKKQDNFFNIGNLDNSLNFDMNFSNEEEE